MQFAMCQFRLIAQHLVATLVLVGASAGARAQDAGELSVTYTSSNGTVAPQYYQFRRITIRSKSNSDFELKHGAEPGHQIIQKASFTPDPAKLRDLMDYVRANHFDSLAQSVPASPPRSRPGDRLCSLYLVTAGNSVELGCAGPPANLIEMMNGLLPSPEKANH